MSEKVEIPQELIDKVLLARCQDCDFFEWDAPHNCSNLRDRKQWCVPHCKHQIQLVLSAVRDGKVKIPGEFERFNPAQRLVFGFEDVRHNNRFKDCTLIALRLEEEK